MPSSPPFRCALLVALIFAIGEAAALGLGEVRSRSALGERLVAEIDVLAGPGEVVDSSCFQLRRPAGDGDLPWLGRASLSLRAGSPRVLEVRSSQNVADPVLRIGIGVACGHEVRRDYTLLLSPPEPGRQPEIASVVPPAAPQRGETAPARKPVPRAAAPALPAEPVRRRERAAPRPEAGRAAGPLHDRLLLSGGGEAGEPSLRLATELGAQGGDEAALQARRDLLRLEFRLLSAMQEQETAQLAADQRLRKLEEALGELARAAKPAAVSETESAATAGRPPASVPQTVPTSSALAEADGLSEWGFYGALLGMLGGVGSWLAWRHYRRRAEAAAFEEMLAEPEAEPEPLAGQAAEPVVQAAVPPPAVRSDVDLLLDGPGAESPLLIDLPLDPALPACDSALPLASDTLPAAGGGEESEADGEPAHSEANPVMELADIMLSFGRVKGAAQALQEYIDQNPQEALQPWLRLMDVYRMAGMRDEFERLAEDLNRHFNVEVQRWEQESAVAEEPAGLDFILDLDEGAAAVASPPTVKAASIEQLGHICSRLVEVWGTPECHAYLHQLLRDNRGGERNGFPLPMVEEILFLIDMLDTLKRMAREEGAAG